MPDERFDGDKHGQSCRRRAPLWVSRAAGWSIWVPRHRGVTVPRHQEVTHGSAAGRGAKLCACDFKIHLGGLSSLCVSSCALAAVLVPSNHKHVHIKRDGCRTLGIERRRGMSRVGKRKKRDAVT